MDIKLLLYSLVSIKIRRDDSYNFTLKEIETFAQIYDMEIDEFCTNILKLSYQQIYGLKKGKFDFAKCTEFKRIKINFFEEEGPSYRLKIIKEKIKKDSSSNFTIGELEDYSSKLEVNLYDLGINILGISRGIILRLKNGEFKTVSSKEYEKTKEEYFNSIEEDILEAVLSLRRKSKFSNKFSYNEITEYSNEFGINIRDFLDKVLGIKKFGEQQKPILETDTYISNKYKIFKHQRMQDIGEKILDDLIADRIQKTGNHEFKKNEIEELSKKYNINIRDFMVYVLGKSEQLYYDIKADRIGKCYSQKYKDKKDDIIISKRENFMSQINPNVRTYYSLEELEKLSANLGITKYDLVVNVMQKSRTLYYNVTNNYRNRNRVSVGEYKSGPLPNDYLNNNVGEILNILKIATGSAIGYMISYGYRCTEYYNDILQDGFIYLSSNGNPIDENGELEIRTSEYKEEHGGILYKKAYFNAITYIKSYVEKRETTGEAYEINIKTKGNDNERLEDDNISLFIQGLSQDKNEQAILGYFSENTLSDETMKEACKIFKVNDSYIQNLFSKLRNKISFKDLGGYE